MATDSLEVVITEQVEVFTNADPLVLESGARLAPVTVVYETYGELNNEGTNAVLVCHALTADAHAAGYHSHDDKAPGWWDGLIGPGRALDTERYFVICPNILGSCYGTTGPRSLCPETGKPYQMSFPPFTVRDIVNVQKKILDLIGVKQLATVTGSSLGGMQALEWAIMYPNFCASVIPISTSAKQSAWCIALNSIARAAITNDPAWDNGHYSRQPKGMGVARMVGMISYRSPMEFEQRFGRDFRGSNLLDTAGKYEVEHYLLHQAEKLVERFDANTYLYLSRAMDLHDITRNRGALDQVLRTFAGPVLCIGVSSDIRYPVREQKELARLIPNARYAEIESVHGHDAFLIEFDQMNRIIKSFLPGTNENGAGRLSMNF